MDVHTEQLDVPIGAPVACSALPNDGDHDHRCHDGEQLRDEARLAGVPKFVAIGTVCAYPKFTDLPAALELSPENLL